MTGRPRTRPTRSTGSALLALGLVLAPALAWGFTTDARRLGMGNAQLPGSRELWGRNVAYQAAPARPGHSGHVVPIPLGLIDLATDFPPLDPDDPDFSATRLANLALNPPFFLELTEPSDLNGDISVFVARNAFMIDFEDARELLPQKPFEVGSVYSTPFLGLSVMGARAYVSPVLYLEGEVAFDDAFYGVLAGGQPILPNSSYATSARGETMGGTALSFGYTTPLRVDDQGNGLYVGGFMKYILGFGMGIADTRFTMATGDTIFGDSNPLDVDYDAVSRYAPFGNVGNGIGFDVGAAYRMGALDIGLGFRDLLTRVAWGKTKVQHSYFDEVLNEVVTETLSEDDSYTQKLPIETTLNVSWTGDVTVVTADLTASSLHNNLHLGAERRVGPMAVRAGLLTDDEARVQYAWGFGVGLTSLWLDIGFQTHNRSFTGERGVTLGTSIGIR